MARRYAYRPGERQQHKRGHRRQCDAPSHATMAALVVCHHKALWRRRLAFRVGLCGRRWACATREEAHGVLAPLGHLLARATVAGRRFLVHVLIHCAHGSVLALATAKELRQADR